MITQARELRLRILNELKRVVIDTHYLNVLEIMNKELKERINQWNKIKYGDDSNRIIIYTLKPQGTVTTAPKIKE